MAQEISTPDQNKGIYIHTPFCRSKCIYCDFNSYSGLEPLYSDYVDSVLNEIASWAISLKITPDVPQNHRFATLYFGGGTPSLLPVSAISRIISVCKEHLHLAPDAEITLEANPGTIDTSKLASLLEAGVNRLSLGVQTFDDRHLKLLGRIHNASEAVKAVETARHAGFTNISVDLMFGLPHQTQDDWSLTLSKATALNLEHISLYSLSVEEDTPLAGMISRGILPSPDPDLAADMYELACERLGQSGYDHYEISNWAKHGFECKHNTIYWSNQPYLGIGAGAHSYLAGMRFSNCPEPAGYIKLISEDSAGASAIDAQTLVKATLLRCHPAIETLEEITAEMEMAETMFLGLRMLRGVDIRMFQDRFGRRLGTVYGTEIRDLLELGLLQEKDDWVALTTKGLLLANEAFLRFLPQGTQELEDG